VLPNPELEDAAGAAPQPGAAGPSDAGNVAGLPEHGSDTVPENHSARLH